MAFMFIRHLPTAYNQQGLLQGKRDEPILPLTALDNKLLATLEKNKAVLSELVIDTVLCSTLKRTQQTALAHHYTSFSIEPLLNELDFGCYEGKSRQYLLKDHGEQWQHDPSELVLGESMQHFSQRIQYFFEKYQQDAQQKNILAFTHGAWIRAARAWWTTGSLQNMNKHKVANNELVILT
ncbi:MAG: histidine phosphatase family protein [bacterium]